MADNTKKLAINKLDGWFIGDVLKAMQRDTELLEIVSVGDGSFEAVHHVADEYAKQIGKATGAKYDKLKDKVEDYQVILAGIEA